MNFRVHISRQASYRPVSIKAAKIVDLHMFLYRPVGQPKPESLFDGDSREAIYRTCHFHFVTPLT